MIIKKTIERMDLREIFSIPIYGRIHVGTVVYFSIKCLVIYLFTICLVWFIKKMFRHSMKKQDPIDTTSSGFLQHIMVWIVYIIGLTAFLSMIPGMKRVADSILASAGILAMAVGLASKEALGNFVSGVFIILGKPFRVGDIIKAGDVIYGTVMEINLRHTVVRNFENKMIMVPNSTMNNATIVNSTIGEKANCSYIEMNVSYSTPLNRAIDTMRDEIMKNPLLIDHRTEEQKAAGTPQVVIRVTELGESAITLRAYAWSADYSNSFVMKCDLLKDLKERFDREHIEMPYPYQNIVMKKEE